VNFASWVMSQAGASEVVVSDTLRGLVAGSDIQFVDRGRRRVKGSSERRRLFLVDCAASTGLPLP